jgi:hypothetical protein
MSRRRSSSFVFNWRGAALDSYAAPASLRSAKLISLRELHPSNALRIVLQIMLVT